MYKSKTLLVIVLMITLIATTITYAEDSNQAYDFEMMIERLISENLAIVKMDNNVELMKLKYEDTLEDYEDLQSTVKDMKNSLELEAIYKEQALEDYKNASDLEEPMAKANYEMRSQIYDGVLDGYRQVVQQEIGLITSMEQLELQIEQGDRQKETTRLKETYNLQTSYYSLYTLEKEIELLETDIDNLKKQQEVESIRFDLDMSTTESLQSISTSVLEMELMLDMLKNQKELSVESIKTKLNIPVEEELAIELELPEVVKGGSYSLANLIKSFKENSLDIEALEKNVEIKETILSKSHEAYEDVEGNDIQIAELELRNAEIDKMTSERDIEMYVKQSYYDYKAKELDLLVKEMTYETYTEKEKNLKARYEQGLISELQYNMELQQIQRSKLQYDKAKIDYLNAKGKLDLIKEGIMLISSGF